MKTEIRTYVTGTKFKNEYGQDIQKIIKAYIEENYDYNSFDKKDVTYESKEDIYLSDRRHYQYELEEINKIELAEEPENPFDENAIKVILKGHGKIGHIPKEHNIEVKKMIQDFPGGLNIESQFTGGPYKYYDEDEDKIKRDRKPYGFNLIITPKEIQTNNKKELSPEEKLKKQNRLNTLLMIVGIIGTLGGINNKNILQIVIFLAITAYGIYKKNKNKEK